MDARTTAVAMLLSDSRFPAGTHAHSLGLEQAVLDGLGAADVPAFAWARIELVAVPEAALSVAARRAVADAGPGALATLVALHAARTPSHVLREQARRLGAQLIRSADKVWPGTAIGACRAAGLELPRPIALGVVAHAAGLDDLGAALVALYDDVATVCSAALKLLPLDPALAARWQAQLAGPVTVAASDVAASDVPAALSPPPAAPALDAAALVHAARRERLFAT
jgi:urease accessory protein